MMTSVTNSTPIPQVSLAHRLFPTALSTALSKRRAKALSRYGVLHCGTPIRWVSSRVTGLCALWPTPRTGAMLKM